MGSLDRAKAHLKRATEIDAKFRLMALERFGPGTAVGIVGQGQSMIIEVRPCEKFKGAWVAFEAPESNRRLQRPTQSARQSTMRADASEASRGRSACVWRRRLTIERSIVIDGRGQYPRDDGD